MAVGGDLAWYSEIEPAACKVMEAHHPGVPNIGDVTRVDWSEVEPVDVLTGGYPCQPFSQAGQRKGTEDERHLWPCVRDAISVLEPGLAVLENVAGHLSLGLGTVLGELSEVGYDARWGVVRAADAGAPHRRARVFIVAYPNGITDGFELYRGAASGAQLESVAGRYVGCDVESVAGSQVSENENAVAFGPYKQAVRRWERLLGRASPVPIVTVNGKDKLNPVFVEWMMGLPFV